MEKLVEKAKKNDDKAFDELILLIEKEMYVIAKSKLSNEEDIVDAIQETILSCYKNLRKLKDNSLFKSWITKILINECNKIYKKKKNVVSFEDNEIDNLTKEYDNNLESVEFDVLIRNLKTEEKLLLTLYYYSNYSIKEISNMLKINEGTIKSKIFRAREKLRNQIGGNKSYERY